MSCKQALANHAAARPLRSAPILLLLTFLVAPSTGRLALGQEKNFGAYSDHVTRYLERIYAKDRQPLAFRDDYPGGPARWQQDARTELRRKLALQRIASEAGDHKPVVELGEPEDLGTYTRRRGTIETEPDVRIPFWLLRPKGDGPWPLGVFPHGHDRRGPDTTAGVYADDAHRRHAIEEDRDVAVQAVKLGLVAIAPAVRGLSVDGVPDLRGRHGQSNCRSHAMHCLIAGRTATGERVWDMQRILDWAAKLPEVDSSRILMMGNSGGGTLTLFTAACDERITVAVPSCSFAPSVSNSGYLFHCDCNMVPGLLELGGLTSVAGLIAPRYLLAVNGQKDPLFPHEAIDRGATEVQRIYHAVGQPDHFEHRWGPEGHRFYKDLMWPFVQQALGVDESTAVQAK